MPLPEFNEVGAVFARLQASMGAAGCHGTLCGMFCGDAQLPVRHWLRAILGASSEFRDTPVKVTAGELSLLQILREETREALAASDMRFAPFLPGDAEPLRVRANALASWCEGFLYGLGVAAPEADKARQAKVDEAIKDITEISRAEADDQGEAGELAYTELVEYLRVAVLLIYEELNPVHQRTVRS